jgi:pantoate--beta-alanine ligase
LLAAISQQSKATSPPWIPANATPTEHLLAKLPDSPIAAIAPCTDSSRICGPPTPPRAIPSERLVTELVLTIPAIRSMTDSARASGATVGLVPTMGFLHEGHRSLMRAAHAECDFVLATIFVNPLQFGPNEDLDRYPRDLEGDLATCRDEGVDAVFAPRVSEMYPRGHDSTIVHVAGLTDGLCGGHRPGHFDGVSTVVAKLFSIVGPCRSYFGRKDAQQLAVVTRLAADLDFPVAVVGCPIVREPDGLALSSRNAYLDSADRAAALVLSRALFAAVDDVRAGERDAHSIVARVHERVAAESRVDVEYVACVDPDSLEPVPSIGGRALLALAVRLGSTRLIDNVVLEADPVG